MDTERAKGIRGRDVEQTTVRLPAGLKEEIQQEADRLGVSFNALVLMILSGERTRRQKE